MAESRFSPRPHRAREIAWLEWGEAAFNRARKEDKPVLLSISATWCHWCHVRDKTTYPDPGNIALISSLYVPVRVDTDQRPDINQRSGALTLSNGGTPIQSQGGTTSPA